MKNKLPIIFIIFLCIYLSQSVQFHGDNIQLSTCDHLEIFEDEKSEQIAESMDIERLNKTVSNFYNVSQENNIWSEDSKHLSKSLLQQVNQNRKKYDGLFLGFDPFVNGQDAKISNLVIHAPQLSDSSATVKVNFLNFEKENVLIYIFVKEDGIWKLDDIASILGDFRWLLSEVVNNP